MRLHMIGCSHHDTSVDFREKLAFSQAQAERAIDRFRGIYPDAEIVLLSTCNRTELYTAALDPSSLPDMTESIELLLRDREITIDQANPFLHRKSGLEAVRHLFGVAGSLDSMVVGEAQILSQVKSAYELSASVFDSMPVMNTVFQQALRVAKRINSETSIQKKRVSIPSVAVSDFAKRIFERFDDKQVLVIGAGEMAEETLTYLQGNGVRHTVVTNRNIERGTYFAQQWEAEFRSWDRRLETIVESDIVISATGATEPIVSYEEFLSIEKPRAQRPLFVLDLAVPRDFEAAIGDRLGVYLFTVDDLREVCEANLKERQKELPKANRIVEQEAERFQADWNVRVSGLTIKQLRTMANDIKVSEYERLISKLGELDEKTRKEINQSFDRLINKLLHPPLQSLRNEASRNTHSALLHALKRLFQLED